jgi:nicotinamidase-related amidase
VDTVIITGVTMAGCVRHTTRTRSATASGRSSCASASATASPASVEWNLFDIDAKFGDVESLETVLDYLDGIEPFAATAPRAVVERPAY